MNERSFVRVYDTKTLQRDLEAALEYWKAWEKHVRVVQIVPFGLLRRKTIVVFEWEDKKGGRP